jgi:hypothetical protein
MSRDIKKKKNPERISSFLVSSGVASLYLSSNKAFRFRYVESDGISPSRLVLEGLDESTEV